MATDREDAPDDDLVAYVDGELDADSAEAVERRLATDAAARTQVEKLRKTYDLLDFLPSPEPSANFASRTVTQIGPAISSSQPMSRGGWAVAGGWIAAALIAAVLGYLGHLLARPHLDAKPQPPTLQQVRLLERLPLYAGVDDLAYVHALKDPDLFGEVDESSSKTAAPSEAIASADLAKLEEAFAKLPAARQDQLRKLDEAFFALPPAEQEKTQATLERYAVWLRNLPENYRTQVLTAPAAEERLEAVRRIRKRQWRDSLPASVRARVAETADVEERDRIYADYRRQEAERRHLWDAARQQWEKLDTAAKPFPFDNPDLSQQVEDYVNTVIKPRLRLDELARLDEMRKQTQQGRYGAWYLYGVQILWLADAHPSLPEPRTGKPIMKVEDLPQDFLRRLRAPGVKGQPLKREFKDLPQHGKWPDFAEAVAREAQDRSLTPPMPLGPSRPGEFKPEVDDMLTALKVKLNAKEKSDLDNLQGKWPQYPKLMLDLARKYDLTVPGVTLPGSPAQWSKTYPLRITPRRP